MYIRQKDSLRLTSDARARGTHHRLTKNEMRITVHSCCCCCCSSVYTRRNAMKNDLSSHSLVIPSVYHPIHHGRQQLKHGGRAAGHGRWGRYDSSQASKTGQGQRSAVADVIASQEIIYRPRTLNCGTLFSFDHRRDASDQLSSENSLFTEARSFEQSIEASARPSINDVRYQNCLQHISAVHMTDSDSSGKC